MKPNDKVTVTMTVEDVAKRWLNDQDLCAIDWVTLDEICRVYRDHGPKTLVFDPDVPTYILRDKNPNETAACKEIRAS